MMTLRYKINKDVVSRTATLLNWNLTSLSSSIYIINKNNRQVNAKSLVGLLTASIKAGDEIQINFSNVDDTQKIKNYFNEIGIEKNY